jgi:predicted amino acid dehydrogenase
MKDFAFIVWPQTIKELKDYCWRARLMPDFLLRLIIRKCRSFNLVSFPDIHSRQGKAVKGYFVVCPGLKQGPKDSILDRLFAAMHFAEQLGVRMIGLNGFAGQVADERYRAIAKEIRAPVTTGNAFTAWAVFEKIYRLAKARQIPLKDATLAVLAADTCLGYLCAKKLADYVKKIFILGENKERLSALKGIILQQGPVEVIIADNPEQPLSEADIVVNADFSVGLTAGKSGHKSGALFCEAAALQILARDSEGRKKFISPALAETILLSLEKRFVSYSLGETLNIDRLEEIADIAARHGFEVWVPEAPLI